MNNITFGDDNIAYYETVAGGAGAVISTLYFVSKFYNTCVLIFTLKPLKGPSWNGRSGIHTHMTNTRITDAEILEKRF